MAPSIHRYKENKNTLSKENDAISGVKIFLELDERQRCHLTHLHPATFFCFCLQRVEEGDV